MRNVIVITTFGFLERRSLRRLRIGHNHLIFFFYIQARSGCACAGPYALDLLGIDQRLSRRYINILEQHMLDNQKNVQIFFRPGFARLNLPYFASDAEIEFILNAVVAVAKNGWTMLPYYQMNSETGEWRHHTHTVGTFSLMIIHFFKDSFCCVADVQKPEIAWKSRFY